MRKFAAPDRPAPVSFDLDGWLDPSAGLWKIPVPAPFALREGRLVGFPGLPGESFSPRETPWLASEFAHLAAETDPERAVLSLVNAYGLTGQWVDGWPPREKGLEVFLNEAREV